MTTALKISRVIKSHFLFTLSIITPANKAKTSPGAVAVAIILPKENSEFVSSRTNQLTDIILNPNPIKEIIFPSIKSRNVGFFKSLFTI